MIIDFETRFTTANDLSPDLSSITTHANYSIFSLKSLVVLFEYLRKRKKTVKIIHQFNSGINLNILVADNQVRLCRLRACIHI